MALHTIQYGGYSTLGTIDADHQDTVKVHNNTDVTVTVAWPSGCFDPAPPATEQVGAYQDSATYTVGASAEGDYQVKVEPSSSKVHVEELPETGVGTVRIVG